MKLIKQWTNKKGDSLDLSFNYEDDPNVGFETVENVVLKATDKNGNGFDLTDLFEEDKELYAILDKMIDDLIKAQ